MEVLRVIWYFKRELDIIQLKVLFDYLQVMYCNQYLNNLVLEIIFFEINNDLFLYVVFLIKEVKGIEYEVRIKMFSYKFIFVICQ